MTKHATADPGAKTNQATNVWAFLKSARLRVLLTSPLIYLCFFAFALLDLFVAVYQAVCFPANGIPKVRRGDYFVFDRGRLLYLNGIEKLGCLYCAYANGLLAYVTEITARTEQHFCPIKHSIQIRHPHSRYAKFLPYGDAQAFRTGVAKVRTDFIDIKTEDAGDPRGPNHTRR